MSYPSSCFPPSGNVRKVRLTTNQTQPITVISPRRLRNHRELDCLWNSLSLSTTKKISKLRAAVTLWVHRSPMVPSQRASSTERFSMTWHIEGILPKGPYLARALLAGYHRIIRDYTVWERFDFPVAISTSFIFNLLSWWLNHPPSCHFRSFFQRLEYEPHPPSLSPIAS